MSAPSLKDRKKEARAKHWEEYKRARAANHPQRQRQRRCFWTWPFGHAYPDPRPGESRKCGVCGKWSPT